MEVDLPRKRIALSLKTNPEVGPRAPRGTGPSQGAPAQGPGGPRRDGPPRSDNRRNAAPAVDWFTAATQKKR
jgi:uncharacterized protein